MLTLTQAAFAPPRKAYRIGLLFTDKNGDFGTISPLNGAKLRRPLDRKWRVTYRIVFSTLWSSVTRYSHNSGSEQVGKKIGTY